MRGVKSTIALAVVLAGLGAYIYFVTWKQAPDSGAATKLEKVFPSLDGTKIVDINVKSESGETTVLKKDQAAAWQITAPVAATADGAEVSGITSNLATLEVSRVVDENPTDLKDYGLANPRIEIDFKAADEKDFRKLLVGEKSPTGAQLFAKRNDEKRVFLIPAFQETTFNRSTFELRDKTVVKFERDKLSGIDVVADGKTLRLNKEGSDWKIAEPVRAKADYASVEGLAGRLQSAQMKSIAANEPSGADLKKYGLDKPAVTVTLKVDSQQATLVIGAKAAENTVYARDLARPAVVTVDSALADELKKGADDYRRKDLFELRADNTNHIEITRNGQSMVFDMTKGTGENAQNKWRRTSPNPADTDREKTEAFLSKLSSLRATSFTSSTAKTGLDNPVMTVRGKFADTKEEGVTFGKVGDEVYAARPGEPGAAKIAANDFNEMIKTLDEVAK